jgi:excisionase family DNA binding protein
MSVPSPLPPLWTLEEVQEYLTISRRTLYRMVADGDLELLRVRGTSRITETSLMAYVEAQRTTAGRAQ